MSKDCRICCVLPYAMIEAFAASTSAWSEMGFLPGFNEEPSLQRNE